MTTTLRETEAIILDCRDYGESDLILTLLNREQGKITAIAKGAKRSKKRFVNKLELFSLIEATLREKNSSSLALLQEAELLASFIHLRQNTSLYIAASVLREFILAATREGAGDKRIYQLTRWALYHLDHGHPPLTVIALFLLRFYDYVGYRPELHTCIQCGVALRVPRRYPFSTTGGGLVCGQCQTSDGHSLRPLAAGTVKMLQSAQTMPLETLHRVKISGAMLHEALDALHRFGRHILQREITSWAMLGLGRQSATG